MKTTSSPNKRRYMVQGALMAGLVTTAGFGIAWSLPSDALSMMTIDSGTSTTAASTASMSTSPTQSQAVEDVVEPALYSRVMRLRNDIAMTNEDLAALGLTEAQAEDVLTRLVEWVELNQTSLIQADNRAHAARRELALMQRRIRTGEADAREIGALSDLHRAVSDADIACEALRVQAGAHAVAPAPGSVQSQWEQACANAHLPVDLRHISGLDDQRLRALMGNAPDPGSPGSGGGQSEVVGIGLIAAGLTLSEQSDRAAAVINIRTHLPGVAAAERRVLPAPYEPEDDALDVEGEGQ